MADQCIVCLENLDTDPLLTPQLPAAVLDSSDPTKTAEPVAATAGDRDSSSSNTDEAAPQNDGSHGDIALIRVCGHMLHDYCLREWSEKANSCPICRQSFHQVQVYDKVGGTILSSYEVADKKQVAEFDPQAWVEDNPEDEEDTCPCPVCNQADREDVLLLCDGCDTPYHTYCIGLDSVPRGAWFCMECVDHLGPEVAAVVQPSPSRSANRSHFLPRTQASMRRARRQARSDDWQGAWGQIASRVWSALSLDLDLDYEEDDAVLEDYRRSQQLQARERQEHQRWQQRLNIASRVGARDVFANSIQNVFSSRGPTPRPQPAEQTREERRAWGAFERARERGESSADTRKRKSRSITASPREPRQEQEPERKLKRPRTRRLPIQAGEASSSRPTVATPSNQAGGGSSTSTSNGMFSRSTAGAPSFLSSLLKEVESSNPSDDESIRHLFGPIPGANDPSSPAASSPAASVYSSPRASSITPPPARSARPTSPIMSLSSHIEPIYPPANYSPTRSSPENSDAEHHNQRHGASELRHPRPRRSQSVKLPRSQDVSPARSPLPLETKESISGIVRRALKPHWKSSKLTSEQFATINRDVSRKLYEGVADGASIDEEARRTWEKIAKKEVSRAVSELKA